MNSNALPVPVNDVGERSVDSTRRTFVSRTAVAVGAVVTTVGFSRPASAATKKKTKRTTAATTVTKTGATTTVGASAATKAPFADGGLGIPAGQELAIHFAFAASNGQRFHNPYVAVWIEDPNGASLRTLALAFKQGRGLRWLPDLRRWYRADQVRQITGGADLTATVSSATRLAGTYDLAWDGLDDKQLPLPAGDYVVCIETAREKGPYSLVKESVTLGSKPFARKVAATGELDEITVDLQGTK